MFVQMLNALTHRPINGKRSIYELKLNGRLTRKSLFEVEVDTQTIGREPIVYWSREVGKL